MCNSSDPTIPLLDSIPEVVDSQSPRYSVAESKLIERHDDSVTRHIAVQCDGTVTHFLVRVIFKDTREKRLRRASSDTLATVIRGNENMNEMLAIRERLSHPNILPLYAVRDTKSFIILFEEWCPEGPCLVRVDDSTFKMPDNCVGPYSEEQLASIFWGVCNGLYYLHEKQICHLNLHPDIFLRFSKTVKLSGLSHITNNYNDPNYGLCSHFFCDRQFQAPECWKDGSFSSYSEDMWSLGVSLYYLCFLRSVIPSASLMDRAQNNENYSQLPDMAKASPELQSLLGQLLNPEVSERPCLRDVLECEWFRKHGFVFQDLEEKEKQPIAATSLESLSWTSPECLDKSPLIEYVTKRLCESERLPSRRSDSSRGSESSSQLRLMPCVLPPPSGPSNLSMKLPKRGIVQYCVEKRCFSYYRRCELYVEKGRMVVLSPRRIVKQTVDLHNAILVQNEYSQVFEVRMGTNDHAGAKQ
ncbi:hypothetical protein WA588_005464 [Blastocystis sp. NMH]